MAITETWPASLPEPSDENFTIDEQPRVRTAKFGDGYEQRVADGINYQPKLFSLDWPNLTVAEKDILLNFVRARGGWEGFFFTPYGESQGKYKAPNWTAKRTSGPFWSVRVTFQEIFEA